MGILTGSVRFCFAQHHVGPEWDCLPSPRRGSDQYAYSKNRGTTTVPLGLTTKGRRHGEAWGRDLWVLTGGLINVCGCNEEHGLVAVGTSGRVILTCHYGYGGGSHPKKRPEECAKYSGVCEVHLGVSSGMTDSPVRGCLYTSSVRPNSRVRPVRDSGLPTIQMVWKCCGMQLMEH